MSIRTTFVFASLALAVTPYSFGQSGQHPMDHDSHMAQMAAASPAIPDSTQPMRGHFPPQLRDHTLSNMRDHLLALAEIQDQLARQRYDKAAEIAEQRLGMSSLGLHGAHEVAKFMPQGMQDAGTAMHLSLIHI